ncbi:hypothetical protein POTOM_028998 [Populus tomentosa]|uniref:Uncharacterized protein n=1 Tax=Populus tomentosa TaxID=118781 RepID=A0A8X7Z872_POPTO|nr:hypothetical protein POTOM_028998 [Populus tomentosa]
MESNPCLPLVFFLIVSCSIAQIELAGMRQSEALGHRYRAKLEGNSNIDSALFQATEHVDISKFHHQEGLKEKDRIESFPGQPKVNVPKTRKTCCKNKECKGHTLHKVTQYKKLGKLRWPCCSRKASADMIARSQARTTGQEEDCLEVAMPELQALVPTRSQGVFSQLLYLFKTISTCFVDCLCYHFLDDLQNTANHDGKSRGSCPSGFLPCFTAVSHAIRYV